MTGADADRGKTVDFVQTDAGEELPVHFIFLRNPRDGFLLKEIPDVLARVAL